MHIVLRLDANYLSVCSWLFLATEAGDSPIKVALVPDSTMGGNFHLQTDNLDGYAGSNEAFAQRITWVPPPVLLFQDDGQAAPPNISAQKANVNGEDLVMGAEIYMFDKRARELGKAEDLLALIGRGGSKFMVNT